MEANFLLKNTIIYATERSKKVEGNEYRSITITITHFSNINLFSNKNCFLQNVITRKFFRSRNIVWEVHKIKTELVKLNRFYFTVGSHNFGSVFMNLVQVRELCLNKQFGFYQFSSVCLILQFGLVFQFF